MDTNWNDIRFFLSVSRTNSFLSAAQQLQVTHSTVSRRISALEDSLQTTLFIRTERGCSLTASGEKLLPLAERLERAALKFQEHILPSESALSGRIRIGTPDGLGNCFLACELNTLQLRYPQLEVELVSVPLYYSLYKREVDILITVQRPTTRKVIAEKIINYRLGFFASQSYLDRSDSIEKLSDLKKHRTIGYIDDLLYDQNLRFMEDVLPAPKTFFRSSTVIAQMNAIKAGTGVGVLPYFMAQGDKSLVHILPDQHIERDLWVQVNPDSSQFARVRETMNFIIETIQSKSALFTSM